MKTGSYDISLKSGHVFDSEEQVRPSRLSIPLGNYSIDIFGSRPVFDTGNEAKELKEDLTNYRRGFDDFDTLKLYKFLEDRGKRIKRVPRKMLYEMFGDKNEPVAGSFKGDPNFYIANELSELETRTAAYHEFGHENEDSEHGSHEIGMRVAASLGDFPAVYEMQRQLKRIKVD